MAKNDKPTFRPIQAVPAAVRLRSLGPYSQSKPHISPLQGNESHDAHERRCWKEHLHVNEKGRIFIGAMAFKNSLVSAAQLLNDKIPGKQNQTFTKQIICGVLIPNGLVLDIGPDDVKEEWVFVDSKGRPGGSSRVWRCYPTIPSWKGELTCYISSPELTPEYFERVWRAAGLMIGIGRHRMEKRGTYGSFEVEKITWR